MVKAIISDQELDAQIEKAEKHHKWSMENEPKAASVKYSSQEKSLIIELLSGVKLSIPLKFIQELDCVPEKEINNATISPLKEMISWEEYDIDISLKGVILKSLNLLPWVEPIIASNKGKIKSEAKSKAARENGRKGGRPSSKNKNKQETVII